MRKAGDSKRPIRIEWKKVEVNEEEFNRRVSSAFAVICRRVEKEIEQEQTNKKFKDWLKSTGTEKCFNNHFT